MINISHLPKRGFTSESKDGLLAEIAIFIFAPLNIMSICSY